MEDENGQQGQGHRRTRSAMVSLLAPSHSHRSKSHSRHTSTTPTPSSSQQHIESPRSTTPAPSVKGSVRGSVKPELQPEMSSSSIVSLTNSGVLVAGPGGGGKTVEETVRNFRLYEALRCGDTSAITRAIRESSGKNGARSSIASSSEAFPSTAKSLVLHLAVQCAELPVLEYILSTTTTDPNSESSLPYLDINQRDPNTGNTPLHVAANLGRTEVVSLLLKQPEINDSIHNYNNRTALEVSRTPQIFQMLQLARSIYLEEKIEKLYSLINNQSYSEIETLLEIPRVRGLLDLNTLEPPTNGGSTLLHDAARKRDIKLIEILLLHGADPFRRDKKGKLPQDLQRSLREESKNGLGVPSMGADGLSSSIGGKEGRETKGYLKKWTNYTTGYKLRWFVLEDGVLSYYKHQDDIGSACRGAINMRIAKLHMDPQDKQRFEIHGKGSVKYHLKANHVVEAKRWYWTLNNAIQFAKDEAREEERRKRGEAEKLEKIREQAKNEDGSEAAIDMSRRGSKAGSMISDNKLGSLRTKGSGPADDDDSDSYEPSVSAPGILVRKDGEGVEEGQGADDDDSSSHAPAEPPSSDALALTANAARLQLDLLSQVVLALQFEHANNPALTLSDPTVTAALTSYDSAVSGLKILIGDCLAMSKERDAYWRYRMEKEVALRRLWEENMALLAHEQDELEGKVMGERQRRKKAKKALREALKRSEGMPLSPHGELPEGLGKEIQGVHRKLEEVELDNEGVAKRDSIHLPLIEAVDEVLSGSDSDSDASAEFFDAVDNGEVEVMTEMPTSIKSPGLPESKELISPIESFPGDVRGRKLAAIKGSFRGYEDGIRERLSMDADDRPKISLWGILKSMIGKDMTKMTLPVSFNEPTSLLQRVAEDMEYTNLLDQAADCSESTERMVYVAAFAASEYSSTTNRVAKPFNPLLGETYEYCRPDRKYQFFIEQVSHHPPIGAAWAEAEKWDYWGESAVKSKFYGKSFDINPLGTWFLRLRAIDGTEELYTWKKVTSSVVGIITGNPTVDNYGPMEIKNWTTGDTCLLDFKARGWRGAGAYEVKGRVLNGDGTQVWSIGGRWNDKIYARLSPGYDAVISPQDAVSVRSGNPGSNAAFLVWQSHPRPPAPFNLTPFAITLNALPEKLKPVLCPTDTRLRPDQRAMEEGEYDFAATEKNRLEEKQRAKRRERDETGIEYEPRWFKKGTCDVTGEEFWVFKGEYWKNRDEVAEGGGWVEVEDIF
ncbi:hypothetical protein L873DRAFT_1661118 [Choiromyces venosus 120613-1]|uniref:PH domain-containing protein n=1 Tax=Choiromyces venosus 120613-1 TaxID=1336337 RepID=A0A3N4K6N2_9PEZI|nr:hypothetical protein L873DRAFT_1661118 [Choiromyces venosus 120613-1]